MGKVVRKLFKTITSFAEITQINCKLGSKSLKITLWSNYLAFRTGKLLLPPKAH